MSTSARRLLVTLNYSCNGFSFKKTTREQSSIAGGDLGSVCVPLENSEALAGKRQRWKVKNRKEKFASASASKRSVTVRCVKDAGNTWGGYGQWDSRTGGWRQLMSLYPLSKRQCTN